ncbi:MAG: hypothetical protein A2148_11715 [Chloroflexi bacterium RBG_16_68_14]|nr:MAG: hypothetical protein A2148_11715 [Chloroflexi bacterium RBG_16_68_14]
MSEPPPLTLTQVAGLLRATAATLRAEADALGPDGLRWHPAPGEWCVNEVLGHIIEAERRGFAGRIREILDQPGKRLESWDVAQVARERRDCERDGLELLREFEELRDESVRLVLGLRPEQMELSGEHPLVGELRIVDLLHEWPHHDRNHVRQILANVQAYVWPHMGNAQRFSEVD